MNIAEMLFNAASGGVLGSALHCVTDYFDTKNKVTLLKANIDAAEKTGAWNAFAASQKTDAPIVIPPSASPWVTDFYLAVEAIKQLTRPLLAWIAICIIGGAYFSGTEDQQKAMQSEVLFGSFTAIFWYFGARYSRTSK
jgi:hypothetical protein